MSKPTVQSFDFGDAFIDTQKLPNTDIKLKPLLHKKVKIRSVGEVIDQDGNFILIKFESGCQLCFNSQRISKKCWIE
jgi:hypothetical protein